MQVLEITTPNPQYTGKTHNVSFMNGRAVVTHSMLTREMGCSNLGQLARKFRADYPNYDVTLKGEEDEPSPEPTEKRKPGRTPKKIEEPETA